jgi:cytochrome b561
LTRNSTTTWGWPAIALHWIGAAFIILLLAHGWWMTHMTPRPERLANYAGHAAMGYDFLVLLVARLLWRWTNPVPALPGDTKPWERLAAHVSHAGLYVLMFATTLVGWGLAGTMRAPLQQDIFGIKVPLIYANPDRAAHEMWENTHRVLAYVLLALVVVHVAAALYHHFVKRDAVLKRMVFEVKT